MVKVWADGAGDGRVCVVFDEPGGKKSYEIKYSVRSHNEAEYLALITALRLINNYEMHHINMDSQLVVEQMLGNYKVRAGRLKKLHDLAWLLIRENGLNVAFFWCKRELNIAGKYLE